MRWSAGTFLLFVIVAGCKGDSGGGGGGGAVIGPPAPTCYNVTEPVAIAASAGGSASAASAGGGRLIVTPLAEASSASVSDALASVSEARPRATSAGGYVLEEAKAGAIATLQATGLFERVERDYVAQAAGVPNDPAFAMAWHLARIGTPQAWDYTPGSPNLIVAVADSGCFQHADLALNLITGRNFITGTTNTTDTLGHGTGVAGTIGAVMNNGLYASGVAPNVKIMPLVVLNAQNEAFYSDIAEAIRWAADADARIVNVSLGGPAPSVELQNAVDYAWARNCVVFASAMNDGTSTPNFPAACARAVAVSGATPQGGLASFSSWGSWIDFAAPGTDIYSTQGTTGAQMWNGTSFATGIASGVAALALSANPSLSPGALVTLLRQTTDDLGAPGFDAQFGWGQVHAGRAVVSAAAAAAGDVTPPIVALTTPACNLIVTTPSVLVQGAAQDAFGVERIEVQLNGQLVDEVMGSSFVFSVPLLPGTHQLTIVAYDTAGNPGLAWTQVTRP